MFQLHFIELTMLRSASFTCLDACCCHGLRLPVFNKTYFMLAMIFLNSTGYYFSSLPTYTQCLTAACLSWAHHGIINSPPLRPSISCICLRWI